MESHHIARMGGRHLSQIREESYSREHRNISDLDGNFAADCKGNGNSAGTSFLPPIVQQQPTGAAGKPGVVAAAERQEERRLSDPAFLALYDEQRKLEDNRGLLEELAVIEAELRESLRLDVERQQEAEFLRQQENKLLWQNLCYLSLSQRVAKPWVSSYFRKFPMHIYCLPVEAANHKGRRRGLKKKR